MLLVGMLFKKGMKGELDLFSAAMAVGKELTSVPSFESPDMSLPLAAEKEVVKNLKKAVLMAAGKAAETFGPKLDTEQEVLMSLADMIIEVYVAESAILRTEKLIARYGAEGAQIYVDMTQLYIAEAVQKVKNHGDEAIACYATGDELKVLMMGMKRFTKVEPYNTKELRRSIAAKMIEADAFPYDLYS